MRSRMEQQAAVHKTMCSVQAVREHLAFLIERVGADERVVVTRDEIPVAALVSMADLEELERLDRARAQEPDRWRVDRPDTPDENIIGTFYVVLGRALAEGRIGFSHGGIRRRDDPPQPPAERDLPKGLLLSDLGWQQVPGATGDGSVRWELRGLEVGALGGQGFTYTARILTTYWPGQFYRLLQETAEQIGLPLFGPTVMMRALTQAGRLDSRRRSEIWGRVRSCHYLDLAPVVRG
jgi:antitoxin (DNA-binding transcriptional repressor) of toxin-antitoxin stability system